MKKSTKLAGIGLAAVIGVFALTASGCTTDADKVDENLITAAESFEVQRTIIGQSGITDAVTFFAEGRCSFEYPTGRRVDVICKHGPDDYRKHVFIMGDQDRVTIVQEKGIDVSEYHTRIVIKPQNILPEFDIMVGEDE
mgnify:CR=1 FL=1